MIVPAVKLIIRHHGLLPTGTIWYRQFNASAPAALERLFNRVAGKPINRPATIRHSSSPAQVDIIGVGAEAVEFITTHVADIELFMRQRTGRSLPTALILQQAELKPSTEIQHYSSYGHVATKDAAAFSAWNKGSHKQRMKQLAEQISHGINDQLKLAPPASKASVGVVEASDIKVLAFIEGATLTRHLKSNSAVHGHIVSTIQFAAPFDLQGPWSAGFNTGMGCGAIRPTPVSVARA